MDTPFVFGKIADHLNFTNREDETHRLVENFTSGINTILISPRRWGKTSLVLKSSKEATKKKKNLKCCHIDLFNVRTEEQFYQLLAQEVIKSTSSKWEDRVENTKKFIGGFLPKITYSPNPDNDFSVGLEWKEVKKSPDEILNLAENIAKSKDLRVIVCIDEFQNIGTFDDAVAFQKKLRANWQKHQYVSYCLYGSKRHMMLDVFASSLMPFYKFGDIVFLKKIEDASWVPFIVSRFADTGKKINKDDAQLIATLADRHPYYVQQLAQQAWLRTKKVCDEQTVKDAFDSLIMQLSFLFQTLTDQLTRIQVNYLRALVAEEAQTSSKDVIDKYQLGTSAGVLRAKEALINKDVLEDNEKVVSFLDPMYRHWLRLYYM